MGPFDVIWLGSVIRLSTPLLFAATGELISERTGIINIGLEGMMLFGAFFGFLCSWYLHTFWLGVLVGMGAGMVLAAIMALLSIKARANQIVVGVGLNIFAAGVTTFAFRQIFTSAAQPVIRIPPPLKLVGLSRIPVVGPALFSQSALVYIAFLFVAVAWFVLYRTSWGLAIRAAGEVPAAADTAGVSVTRIRWIGTIVAGGAAGIGGAFLSIGQLGLFVEGMSAGRGFIALAAVIFGGWGPWGVLGACLVFGSADALQLRIQAASTVPRQVWMLLALIAIAYLVFMAIRGRQRSIAAIAISIAVSAGGLVLFAIAPKVTFPPQLWLSVPYAAALLALTGIVGRVRMPTGLAIPYRRGGDVAE